MDVQAQAGIRMLAELLKKVCNQLLIGYALAQLYNTKNDAPCYTLCMGQSKASPACIGH